METAANMFGYPLPGKVDEGAPIPQSQDNKENIAAPGDNLDKAGPSAPPANKDTPTGGVTALLGACSMVTPEVTNKVVTSTDKPPARTIQEAAMSRGTHESPVNLTGLVSPPKPQPIPMVDLSISPPKKDEAEGVKPIDAVPMVDMSNLASEQGKGNNGKRKFVVEAGPSRVLQDDMYSRQLYNLRERYLLQQHRVMEKDEIASKFAKEGIKFFKVRLTDNASEIKMEDYPLTEKEAAEILGTAMYTSKIAPIVKDEAADAAKASRAQTRAKAEAAMDDGTHMTNPAMARQMTKIDQQERKQHEEEVAEWASSPFFPKDLEPSAVIDKLKLMHDAYKRDNRGASHPLLRCGKLVHKHVHRQALMDIMYGTKAGYATLKELVEEYNCPRCSGDLVMEKRKKSVHVDYDGGRTPNHGEKWYARLRCEREVAQKGTCYKVGCAGLADHLQDAMAMSAAI